MGALGQAIVYPSAVKADMSVNDTDGLEATLAELNYKYDFSWYVYRQSTIWGEM